MNNKEHFNRSVAALVRAYFDDTLEATDCAACACGNLIAAANGYKLTRHIAGGQFRWEVPASGERGVHTLEPSWQEVVWGLGFRAVYDADGLIEIASTGYTPQQFASIEDAFMSYPEAGISGMSVEEIKLWKLMNVVSLLADIHGIDLTTAEAAKALFVRA